MIEIDNTNSIKSFIKELEGSVGFVPTMGALHEGHISLIKRSVDENDHTIVSVFVNPTQFLEGEDLDKYPRRLEADRDICKRLGVDALFIPSENSIYSSDEIRFLAPKIKGYILEGFYRAGHFNGVLQIVLKLLNLISPNRAYFGKKDAQQLYLIKKMVDDLFIDTKIVECEIVRETDGLALSSRNIYLSSKERERALSLSRSLKVATNLIISGKRESKEIKDAMLKELEVDKLDYIEIVDRDFNIIEEIELKNSIILVAAHVGNTRLIDNMWV